jgi:uncharacterized protein
MRKEPIVRRRAPLTIEAKDGSISHKSFTAPFKFTKGIDDEGNFSGYASIFGNVDLGGDIVERGAFARADMMLNKDGKIRIAYHHNLRQIIGLASVEQDDVGLKFDGQLLLGLAAAREAHILMKANAIEEMSIGYDSLEDEMKNSGVRSLKRLKLYEISPVTFAMNPLARIDRVKQCTDIRAFENLLRDECGFSNSQAKLLASGGWKALQQARDETGDEEQAAAKTIDGLNSFLIDFTKSITKGA